jgi:hypothetical protein
MNIQSVRCAWTVPSRRWRTAPKVLKTAPWRMSVPTASVGLKPNRKMSSGVISAPPRIPVAPTSRPISRPVSESSQVTEL